MPPAANNNTVLASHQEHNLLRRTTLTTASAAKRSLDAAVSYAPERVQELVNSTEERVHKRLSPVWSFADPIIKRWDHRLDSMVINPASGMLNSATEGADRLIDRVQDPVHWVDTARSQASFVVTACKDACTGEPVEEGEERPTLLQAAQDKVSLAFGSLHASYYQVLATADSSIEVYFPEGKEEPTPAPSNPVALGRKAAKRLHATTMARMAESRRRTSEELGQLVHVDLISYASEVIDASVDVALWKPLHQAGHSATHAKGFVVSQATQVRGHVDKALAALYNDKIAAAYQRARDRASKAAEYVVVMVKGSAQVASDKLLLVYHDGLTALVVELRREGYLPADGELTLKNLLTAAKVAPASLRCKANAWAEQAAALAVAFPALARAKLAALHEDLIARTEGTPEAAKAWVAGRRAWAEQKGAELVALAHTAPELAQEKLAALFAALVAQKGRAEDLFATMFTKLQEATVAAPDVIEDRFPHLVARLRSLDAAVRARERWGMEKWALVTDKASTAAALVMAKAGEVRANPQEALTLAQTRALQLWIQALLLLKGSRATVAPEATPEEEPAVPPPAEDQVEEPVAVQQPNYSTADEEPTEAEEATEAESEYFSS